MFRTISKSHVESIESSYFSLRVWKAALNVQRNVAKLSRFDALPNGTRFSRREASASERSGRLKAHVGRLSYAHGLCELCAINACRIT